MARKFLYVIAIIIVAVISAMFALRIWGEALSRLAFVPGGAIERFAPLTSAEYAKADLWIARPGVADDPSNWRPAGVTPAAQKGPAAVFFIHPTSYLKRARWNASLNDPDTDARTRAFLRPMTSAFADVGEVWAPRYRQATLGAFLTEEPEGQLALALAYGDVLAAFDAFVAAQPADKPIILAGHSQGSMHLMRLLKERIAGKPIARRIVAAYVAGWPVPLRADLPALGLPACTAQAESGCILSWQSFAEPAGYGDSMAIFEAQPGMTGGSRVGDRYLCTNPVAGKASAQTPASANPGMVKGDALFNSGELVRPGVAARCDAKGFLLIGPGPDLGPLVLPDNNYHAYDYPLFWEAVRTDVARRLSVWTAAQK